MSSRVDKYSNDSDNIQSRVSRNARLYESVYDEHGDLENLPLADNTRDIDINKLKDLISGMDNEASDDSALNIDDSFWENKKRNIDNDRVYDINKMLEKAKYENGKLKDSESELLKTSRQILSTLDIDDKYDEEDTSYDKESEDNYVDDKLSMTREMKYHTKQLSRDPLIEQVMPTNDLAMDLFFDLKPTGDTMVTKPIKEDSDDDIPSREIDLKKVSDTSDIDIIKKDADGIDKDFFTSSYAFSDNDFSDDDDEDDGESSNVLKIILLVLGILILLGLIVYFVMKFGFGV